jgi:hypothetical protein
LNFAQRELNYPPWFGRNPFLTRNPDFDNFGRFAQKRRKPLRKRRNPAMRTKFEDNLGASLGRAQVRASIQGVPLRRTTLKDL